MRSRFLSLAEGARGAGVHPCTIGWHRDFGSLVVVRFDDGSQAIREDELRRWMAERAKRQAARRARTEQRRQERAERRERWLADIAARHGLAPTSDNGRNTI